MPVFWVRGTFLRSFRSSQKDTVSLCRLKGFKVAVRQTLKMIPLSGVRFRASRVVGRETNFFKPPNSTACTFADFWPTETHSTSLERSKSTQHFKDRFFHVKVTPFPYFLRYRGSFLPRLYPIPGFRVTTQLLLGWAFGYAAWPVTSRHDELLPNFETWLELIVVDTPP